MKVLCIIGPSGSGKSVVVQELSRLGIVSVSPTYTDRPKRANETELEHKFVSSEKFDQLASQNTFIETAQLFGLKYRYGLPPVASQKGKVSIVMLRAPLINRMRAIYPDIVVYQIEAPFEIVTKRLKNRAEPNIGSRLTDYEKEVSLGRSIADRVFINDGTISDLANKIAADLQADFSNI